MHFVDDKPDSAVPRFGAQEAPGAFVVQAHLAYVPEGHWLRKLATRYRIVPSTNGRWRYVEHLADFGHRVVELHDTVPLEWAVPWRTTTKTLGRRGGVKIPK